MTERKGFQMSDVEVSIRPIDELSVEGITVLDEKMRGEYQPDVWESRIMYYLRRDPEGSFVAEADGRIVGFAFGEVRAGEFGLEEPTGWVEVLGVDPDLRNRSIAQRLADSLFRRFRELGATRVRTLVEEDAKGLLGFFEATGFRTGNLVSLVMDLPAVEEGEA